MDIPRDSRTLVVAAVILACVLSKGRTEPEMAQLAAFLTVAGDALALLSLQPDCGTDVLSEQESCGSHPSVGRHPDSPPPTADAAFPRHAPYDRRHGCLSEQ